jgi:hypothetical protein
MDANGNTLVELGIELMKNLLVLFNLILLPLFGYGQNKYYGTFTGSGSGLTNLNPANISTNGSTSGQVLTSSGGVTSFQTPIGGVPIGGSLTNVYSSFTNSATGEWGYEDTNGVRLVSNSVSGVWVWYGATNVIGGVGATTNYSINAQTGVITAIGSGLTGLNYIANSNGLGTNTVFYSSATNQIPLSVYAATNQIVNILPIYGTNGTIIAWFDPSGNLNLTNNLVVAGSVNFNNLLFTNGAITTPLANLPSLTVAIGYGAAGTHNNYPANGNDSQYVIIGYDAGNASVVPFNPRGAVLIGNSAGYNISSAQHSVLIGDSVGNTYSRYTDYGVAIGYSAGDTAVNNDSNMEYSVVIGSSCLPPFINGVNIGNVYYGNRTNGNAWIPGYFTATNGMASYATNTLTMGSTGITNTTRVLINIHQLTGTSMVETNNGIGGSLGTVTTGEFEQLQPNGFIIGTGCSAGWIQAQ